MDEPTVQIDRLVRPVKSAVDRGIRAFNVQHMGPARAKSFAVSVREADVLRGGAYCTVRRGWLFIDTLWLEEGLRGRDLGTAVMDLAERHARTLGAHLAYLDTNSFQARPFYEKRGYRVFGQLDDPKTGFTRYWMSKAL